MKDRMHNHFVARWPGVNSQLNHLFAFGEVKKIPMNFYVSTV